MIKRLFVISIIGFISIIIFEKIDYQVHSIEIDNIFLNDISSDKHDYIGYIEIDRLNIKREIVLGINETNLKTHVTLSNQSKSLDSDNIILAGHSIKNIFGNLHKAKINDEIKIYSLNNLYLFKIVRIEIVPKNQIEVIDDSELILITCTYDNRRLIIKAKRI